MLNRCEFIGFLGRDPEVKTFGSGSKLCNLSLAVSEKRKDKSGELKEHTTWVPVVIWNENLVTVAERYLAKGSKVYIAGQFEVRKWTAQDGGERYSTEIVLRYDGKLIMLDKKGEGPTRDSSASAASSSSSYRDRSSYEPRAAGATPRQESYDDLDDEIPF
jgi:single-strand DNA-binding protein